MLGERALQPRTVVVVEDEFIVRDHAVALLEELGFPIEDFATADEALTFLEGSAGEVFALFTDVRTPGVLDGVGLAQVANERWPWIRIMVASAFALADIDDLPPDATFIRKPWLPLEVITTVSNWADPRT
jgi:two-component system, response regulator PdtaR